MQWIGNRVGVMCCSYCMRYIFITALKGTDTFFLATFHAEQLGHLVEMSISEAGEARRTPEALCAFLQAIHTPALKIKGHSKIFVFSHLKINFYKQTKA